MHGQWLWSLLGGRTTFGRRSWKLRPAIGGGSCGGSEALEQRLAPSVVAGVEALAKGGAHHKKSNAPYPGRRELGVQAIGPESAHGNKSIKVAHKTDYYRFEVSAPELFRAALATQKGDANLVLYDSARNVLASSGRAGNAQDNVSHTLVPGTYYLGVSGGSRGKVKYQLTTGASAVPVPSSNTGAGSALSPSPNDGGGTSGTDGSGSPSNTDPTSGGSTGSDGSGSPTSTDPTSGGTTTTPPPANDPGAFLHGLYVGASVTTMNLLDAFSYQVIDTEFYQTTSALLIRAPLVAQFARRVETNPIDLLITPTQPNAPNRSGDLYFQSAGIAFAGSRNDEALFQYQTIQLTGDGFVGALTDTHQQEAIAANEIFAPGLLVPGRPSLGTTFGPYAYYDARYGNAYQTFFTARLQGSRLSIEIKGLAAMGSNIAQFDTVIVADRVS